MLQHLTLFVLILNLTAIAAMAVNTTNYAGAYKLSQLFDGVAPNRLEVVLPSADFAVQLQADSEVDQYRLTIKLGNNMGGVVKVSQSSVDGRDAFSMDGPMFSTRMMPPPELFAVERAVSKIVPAMEQIYFDNDELVLEGPKGSMRCTKTLT